MFAVVCVRMCACVCVIVCVRVCMCVSVRVCVPQGLYVAVSRVLSRGHLCTPRPLAAAIRTRLVMYIVVLTVLQSASVANRIQNELHRHRPSFTLYLLQSAATPLQARPRVGVSVCLSVRVCLCVFV